MKNVFFATILLGLFGFVFSGCETPLTENPEDLQLELRSAQTNTQHFLIPIQGRPLAPPPCAFEPVIGLSGYFNGVVHTTANANGYHVTIHYNASKGRLLGLETGTIYVSNFNQQESTNMTIDAFPYTHSQVIRSQVAAKGLGQVLLVKITVKMVFNAQGEAVVTIDNVECDNT